jgi:fibroblast growth factor receptor 2
MMPRWCAPEVIQKRKYSTQSDVWAFGMTMWEIFSSGTFPYFDCSNSADVLGRIMSDKLPPPPSACPEAVYAIMKKCWARVATQRIAWKDLVQQLEGAVSESVKPQKATFALYE